MSKAPYLTSTFVLRLGDKSSKCRMAALRALKCMGKTASQFLPELEQWHGQWVAGSPLSRFPVEPITTRALMFPHAPLKHIFKGPAPLGNKFAGSKGSPLNSSVLFSSVKPLNATDKARKAVNRRVGKAIGEARQQEYVSKIEEAKLYHRTHFDTINWCASVGDITMEGVDDPFDAKESYALHREQSKQRATDRLRNKQRKEQVLRRAKKGFRSCLPLAKNTSHRSKVTKANLSASCGELSEEWIIPAMNRFERAVNQSSDISACLEDWHE